MAASMRPRRLTRRRLLVALLAGLPLTAVAALTDGLWLEPRWLKLRRLKLSAAPRCRFVHFTDLHYKGDRAYLQKVVARINALKPEFVCFTGDLIEEAQHLEGALAELVQIKAPVYGIPGNHDFWARVDFAPIERAFARTGGAWLEGRSVSAAGGRVQMHGIAQLTQAAAVQVRPGAVNLLLVHYPLWAEAFAGRRFDLILAGHTHGGQVRLPFIGALVVPFDSGRYDLGRFDTPSGPLYVSSGIGTFYANVRFNCRPEIVLVEV